MRLEHEELTGQIIGAAIEVHKTLGPGYVETVYENALALELRARNIPFQRQLTVPVVYRGSEVGLQLRHRSFLPAGRGTGAWTPLNFAKITLEVKRVIASDAERPHL